MWHKVIGQGRQEESEDSFAECYRDEDCWWNVMAYGGCEKKPGENKG